MALSVTFHAQSPVQVAHVTYKVEHALIVNMECMAATVTRRVPLTVKTAHVTSRMGHVQSVGLDYMEITVISRVQLTVKIRHVTCTVEHVLHASLDGQECIATQVRILEFVFCFTIHKLSLMFYQDNRYLARTDLLESQY